MDVRNCKGCGKMFNYVGKSLCPDCMKAKEDEFREVKAFIRENPSTGVSDVAEATGVSVNQIRQWIREERLILTSPSADAGINCESCGRPITSGRMCESCKKQVSRDLSSAFVSPTASTPEREKLKADGNKMRYLSGKDH